MNIVVLRGTLSRDVSSRELPSGHQVAQLELTVRQPGEPTASVPLAWVDPPARALAWTAGTELVVRGRVQRRFFRVNGVTTSRTEVAIEVAIPARQRARSVALVRAASQVLADRSESESVAG